MNRYRVQATTLRKYIHRILPTRSYTHRYDPTTPLLCPLCSTEIEDFQHLFRCAHSSRAQWRQMTVQAIQESVQHFELPHCFHLVLTAGINAAFHNQSLNPHHFSSMYTDTIISQNQIGWMNFAQGRVAINLEQQIDNFLHSASLFDEKHTGSICIHTILTTLIDQVFVMWDKRNQTVHGIDLACQKQIQRNKLLQDIRSIAADRHLLLACDRDHFPTEDEVQTKFEFASPTFMRNWLRTWKPVFKNSCKEAERLAISTVPAIHTFFRNLHSSPSARPQTKVQ